jgi:hypothetical protein
VIAYNDLAPLAQKLRIFAQKFKEALVSYLEFKKGNSDVILSGVEQLDKADAILQIFEKQEAAIATDSRLSAIGKQEQMAKMVAEFHPQFRFVGDGAKDRRNAADELRKKFTSAPKAVDNEMVDYFRNAEIRQRLAPLSMSERMKIVAQAMTNGQPQVLRAISMDPLGEPLVDSEFLQRLQEQHAQKTDGKEWVRMESLVFVAERLDQLATAIDLQLSHYNEIPSFTGQPTRTTDLGHTDTQAGPPKNTAADRPPTNTPAFV